MDQPKLTARRDGPGPGVDAGGILLVLVTIIVFILPALIYFPPMLPSKTEALLQTHSPIGRDPRRDRDRDGNRPAQVRSLCVYPVKSCKGIEVSRSKVMPAGLQFDRLYTFAQLKSPFPVSLDTPESEKSQHAWEFITQRHFPLLATLEVDVYVPDLAKTRGHGDASGDAFIVVRFPWVDGGFLGALRWLVAKLGRGWRAMPEKEILLPASFPSPEEVQQCGYSYEELRVWRDTPTALNMEAELPRELRLYLGVSNRLGIFRIDPARLRNVYRCAPTEVDAGYQPVIGFQDAYPLHLLNLSSVRDVETKMTKDEEMQHLDPRRFRANIIIDNVAAYEEETWKTVRFHHHHHHHHPQSASTGSDKQESPRFHVSCRTVRCKMPNVDQDSGHRHPVEPDRTLRRFRNVDAGAKHSGCLGMQLTPLFDGSDAPETMETWLEVGMGVEVLTTGDHLYIVK